MTPDTPSVASMPWWRYVLQHSGGDANATIAKHVGVTAPSVGRWSRGTNPDPAQAAAFARHYGRPVLEAFIAAGFLTAEEAGEIPSAPPSLAELDDDELIDEVRSRMRRGETNARSAAREKTPPLATVRAADDRTNHGRTLRDRLDGLGEEPQDT